MHGLKRLAEDRPVAFCLVATAAFVAALVAVAVAGVALGGRLAVEAVGALGRLTLIAPVLVVLSLFGWVREAGLAPPRSSYSWLIVVVPFGYSAVVYPWLLTGRLALTVEDPLLSILVAANGLAAGVLEEVVFRGLILHVLVRAARRFTIGGSLLLSSLLFSVPHALNALAGADPVRVSAQLVWAFLLGIVFGSLALAGRNVWPVAALHGLLNAIVHVNALGGTIALTLGSAALLAAAPLPLNVYGGLLLWRQARRPAPARASA